VKFTKKQTTAEWVDTKNELEHGRGIEKADNLTAGTREFRGQHDGVHTKDQVQHGKISMK
jgi:hypothetical protein